jgi:hypothetical protein
MRGHTIKRVLGGALAGLAGVIALGGTAFASATPPIASSVLPGTWANINSATNSVRNIVIQSNGRGGIVVDAFGACTPSSCEWGRVPALVYGPNVSAKTGATFQTNQRFLTSDQREWSRTVLLGKVTRLSTGALRLTVREMTVFEDGSGRRNFTLVESFALGEGPKTTKDGLPVTGYPIGFPPAALAAMAGDWKNTSASPAVAELKIAISGGTPTVRAFGACSPSNCDMGEVRGITYGANISSTTGRTVLAPFSFGFKNEQLVITYSRGSDGVEHLTVGNYNEFTDGSGRSNYAVSETFIRA